MALIALLLAVCALCFCFYLYLESQKTLSKADVAPALSQASDDLSKTYARQFRELETEWADMYSKFSRLAGRIDKVRGLESPPIVENRGQVPVLTGSRSDLLRKHRGGA